jgi:mannose-6-phosphate isomerase-like protein (cupin superfamily)
MSSVDLTAVPVHETTSFGRWQALNKPLGVSAFGISAMVCDPGELFSIAHDESETGQEEAYIVVAGKAHFVIGDDEFDAGPGDVVAVGDPSVNRDYRALEPNTRIVCIGAKPSADNTGFGEWIESGEA